MRFPVLLLAASVALLTSCSLTLKVQGQMQASDESFTGSATGYMDGSGHLTITSNRGVTCGGDFVYVTRRTGEGVLKCDDGRTGPFSFVSTGRRGTGTGDLNGRRFTFTFGN